MQLFFSIFNLHALIFISVQSATGKSFDFNCCVPCDVTFFQKNNQIRKVQLMVKPVTSGLLVLPVHVGVQWLKLVNILVRRLDWNRLVALFPFYY